MLASLAFPNYDNLRQTNTKEILHENLHILVVSRRDYNNRSIKRKIQNEKDLVVQLQTRFATNATVELVDFAPLSMMDQIKKWMEFDITVAAHGSSQVYMTYSPLNSAHIEIQHPERFGNFHYRNLAKLLGEFKTYAHQITLACFVDFGVLPSLVAYGHVPL